MALDVLVRRADDDYNPSIGMRTRRTWTEEEVPKGYREGVNYLWPQGKATLTGLLSQTKKIRETQSEFTWFEKKRQVKNVDATISGGGAVAEGDSINVGITTGFMNMIREGHEVLLRTNQDHSKDVLGKVTAVNRTSTPTLDMTVTGAGDTTNTDILMIVGNINPEASVRPASISYNAERRRNLQQIWRNSMSMSRSEMRNKSRLGERYKDLKMETWQDHAEEQEGCFLWGRKKEYVGDNGESERLTGGFIPEIQEYAPQNIIDAARITAFAGDTFANFGLELLEENLIKNSFLWGEEDSKIVLIGNNALGAIQRMVRGSSQYNIEHGAKVFGINVMVLTTPYGEWHLKRYTPFNHNPSLQNSMLAFNLNQLAFHYTDDFHFEKDKHFMQGGGSGLDGLVEAFLTEGGLEFNHVEKAIYTYNFGLDSLLPAP